MTGEPRNQENYSGLSLSNGTDEIEAKTFNQVMANASSAYENSQLHAVTLSLNSRRNDLVVTPPGSNESDIESKVGFPVPFDGALVDTTESYRPDFPNRIYIPRGFKAAQFTAALEWQANSERWGLQICKNKKNVVHHEYASGPSNFRHAVSIMTPIIPVDAGDFYELCLFWFDTSNKYRQFSAEIAIDYQINPAITFPDALFGAEFYRWDT